MFKQSWSTEYNQHKIKVTNDWFGPSELFIDEKLQDKITGIFSARLIGKIDGKEIKVAITATFFSIECDIFVKNEAIYSSKN